MRPQSILNFERLYLGALAIALVASLLTWDATLETLRAQPNGESVGPTVLYVGIAISVIIPLLLWFFVARKASVVAKWILVALFVLGLLMFLAGFGSEMAPKGLTLIASAVTTLMQAVAIYFLFRPDAKAWFADGRGGPDPEVFR
jgi:hypothetical protein